MEKIQKRKNRARVLWADRAQRKTMALKVSEDGTVTVRIPYGVRPEEADRFVEAHGIGSGSGSQNAGKEPRRGLRIRTGNGKPGSGWQRSCFLKKCRYFAERMGVSYGTVTVREQKTRWGSCSAKGNLNFNWKLALMPEEILDYLVVHELAHRVEMNHSPAFWAVVAEEIPDYKTRREWLRQNGAKF